MLSEISQTQKGSLTCVIFLKKSNGQRQNKTVISRIKKWGDVNQRIQSSKYI
jgi:hypothetical protein